MAKAMILLMNNFTCRSPGMKRLHSIRPGRAHPSSINIRSKRPPHEHAADERPDVVRHVDSRVHDNAAAEANRPPNAIRERVSGCGWKGVLPTRVSSGGQVRCMM